MDRRELFFLNCFTGIVILLLSILTASTVHFVRLRQVTRKPTAIGSVARHVSQNNSDEASGELDEEKTEEQVSGNSSEAGTDNREDEAEDSDKGTDREEEPVFVEGSDPDAMLENARLDVYQKLIVGDFAAVNDNNLTFSFSGDGSYSGFFDSDSTVSDGSYEIYMDSDENAVLDIFNGDRSSMVEYVLQSEYSDNDYDLIPVLLYEPADAYIRLEKAG